MTQSNQGIDAEAARWAVRLHAGPLAPPEQSELDSWLEADARHRGALLRARAAWLDVERLAALAAHRESRNAHPSPLAASAPVTNRRWFIAAGITSLTLVGAGAWWTRRIRGHVYTSEVGEVRRVTLADGSNMLLNTATQAAVHFSKARRDVQLVRGEGLFEVAKDSARPFVVYASGVSIRAVGTVFAVRALDKRVDVTVTEGVVEVIDTRRAAGTLHHRVAANERAVAADSHDLEVQPIGHAQAQRQLAWREGMVAFDGEPLAEAVAEINRHNHRHIVVDDPSLGARSVVGFFRASDTDGFAATVATALGAESIRDDDAIHLRPGRGP